MFDPVPGAPYSQGHGQLEAINLGFFLVLVELVLESFYKLF